jgi:hypothetical protein
LALALVTLVAACALVPLPAAPHSAGVVGQTRSGCSCHNQTESVAVEAQLDGLPGRWEAGEEYKLTLSFEGGPPKGLMARGGFDLRASHGELVVPDGSLDVRVDPGTGEATQTWQGSNASSWKVLWRAPGEDKGTVTFVLVVNAVDGDGVQGPGDQWGRGEWTVDEKDAGGLAGSSMFWMVVAAAGAMAIAALAWYATRGPRIER